MQHAACKFLLIFFNAYSFILDTKIIEARTALHLTDSEIGQGYKSMTK